MTDMKTPDPVVKTAGRVFEILEFFREVRAPLSVREISERFEYPFSSTVVLMKSLATLGYLTYDHDLRAYFPTLRVASLGDWLYDAMYGGGDVMRLLEDICRDTGETAMLAIQNDIYSQYVHILPNRQQVIQLNVPAGTRRLLCWCGTGWAILSQHTDEAIERLIERTLARLHNDPLAAKITRQKVFQQVREVRKTGYAFSNRTVTDGAGVIAMPLPVTSNGMRLAVAAGGVADRLSARKTEIATVMAEHVKKYAASLQQ
ncbi:MAG: helix-turn-helix domain-containing protein [Pseudomonadota bacterium]